MLDNKKKSYKQDQAFFTLFPFLNDYKKKWFTNRIGLDAVNIATKMIALPFFVVQLPFVAVAMICQGIIWTLQWYYKGILFVTGLLHAQKNLDNKKQAMVQEMVTKVKAHVKQTTSLVDKPKKPAKPKKSSK